MRRRAFPRQAGRQYHRFQPLRRTSGQKAAGFTHELVPHAKEIALLINPVIADAEERSRELEETARPLGVQLLPLIVKDDGDFETAFATIDRRQPGALYVFGSPFFDSWRDRIVALAARHAIPATYAWREFVLAGGLMSFGTRLINASRQTGLCTGRILKGEKPAELPVQQPTTFDLVINLKTAKTLDLAVPPTLLASATEVIE
jgi:putative tryptophan/tyrosine transport system substrate-binding protein